MTMTAHALTGLAITVRMAGRKGSSLPRGRSLLLLASCLAGHVLLDRLPHSHPGPLLDLAGLGLAVLPALGPKKRYGGAIRLGLAAAVLPDLFHLLPRGADVFHPPWISRRPGDRASVIPALLAMAAGRPRRPAAANAFSWLVILPDALEFIAFRIV